MKLSGLIIETSTVHSTKSARPLYIVKFEFQGDNGSTVFYNDMVSDPEQGAF